MSAAFLCLWEVLQSENGANLFDFPKYNVLNLGILRIENNAHTYYLKAGKLTKVTLLPDSSHTLHPTEFRPLYINLKAMITIENAQLNSELQELYLVSKHWNSDLDFLATDFDFVKKLFGTNVSSLVRKDEFERIADFMIKAVHIDKLQAELRIDIAKHLQALEPLINEDDHEFKISLIESHSQLEQKLNQIMIDFNSYKKIVFILAKEGLKVDATDIKS